MNTTKPEHNMDHYFSRTFEPEDRSNESPFFISIDIPYTSQRLEKRDELLSFWLRKSPRSQPSRPYSEALFHFAQAVQDYQDLTESRLHDIVTRQTIQILDSIQSLKYESLSSHAKLLSQGRTISSQLDLLVAENSELKHLLDSRYSARTLFLGSSLASFGLLTTLVAWYAFEVFMVHPALSIPLFLGTVGFAFLSHWRMK